MKLKLTEIQVLGILRHVLTFGGGILVAEGTISSALETQIIGGIITVVGAIWSIVSKPSPTPPTPPTPLSGTTV